MRHKGVGGCGTGFYPGLGITPTQLPARLLKQYWQHSARWVNWHSRGWVVPEYFDRLLEDVQHHHGGTAVYGWNVAVVSGAKGGGGDVRDPRHGKNCSTQG
jgi:hypothetical protein